MNEIPNGWGEDELSKFIELARFNTFITYNNVPELYDLIKGIDATYQKAVDHLNNPHDFFCAFFLLRAHASYRAGIQCALSGQIPETYMLLGPEGEFLQKAQFVYYMSLSPERSKPCTIGFSGELSRK